MMKDKVSCSISMMFSLDVVGFFALSTFTFIRPSGSINIYTHRDTLHYFYFLKQVFIQLMGKNIIL